MRDMTFGETLPTGEFFATGARTGQEWLAVIERPLPAHSLIVPLDQADVATVPATLLERLLDITVELGAAMILFENRDGSSERASIADKFWTDYHGPHHTGIAALTRFWALLDALQTRRLKDMFLYRGLPALIPLAEAASATRLNLIFGFRIQPLVDAVQAVDRVSPPAFQVRHAKAA